MEKWATIKECKRYEISNLGRIRNVKTKRLIKPAENQNGYQIVCLIKDKKKTMFAVARLVGLYFVPKRKGAKEINHKNLKRNDNRMANLEWLTKRENIIYSQGTKVILTNAKYTWCKRTFKTLKEASKFLKASQNTLKKYSRLNKPFKGYYISLEKGGNVNRKL